MEFFKTILPIITLFLGAYLAPFIEVLKRKKEQSRFLSSITIELGDNLSSIESDIKTIYNSINTRVVNDDDFIHLSLPLEIEFTLLNKHLSDIYPILTRDQRRAMRVLLTHEKTMIEKRQDIVNKYRKSNNECLDIEQSLFHSYLCVYYILNGLINQGKRYQQGNLQTYEILNKTAKALGLTYPINYLSATLYFHKKNQPTAPTENE
ncbi:TPA: hypothetical protein SMF84_000215 [Serratia marcescens]|nr:hypothetical protein [Serratia marcescens]HEJ7181303.1 hypothetical protein [Serratia marcescens]HEJ7210865.1 hypothetical protein [Serratia marcescens]